MAEKHQKLTEQKIQEMTDLFNSYDEDGNGSLDRFEMVELLKSLGQNPTEDEVIDMINEVDYDGNGTIELDEFVMIMKKRNTNDIEEYYKKIFQEFDEDGNGSLSILELKNGIERLGVNIDFDEIEAILDKVQVNDKGELDYEEFIKMMVISM